eukprot:scaffold630769_cov19-Prasinocladus_malaysianus.AAC.1
MRTAQAVQRSFSEIPGHRMRDLLVGKSVAYKTDSLTEIRTCGLLAMYVKSFWHMSSSRCST